MHECRVQGVLCTTVLRLRCLVPLFVPHYMRVRSVVGEAGCQIILDTRYRILDTGYRILDIKHLTSNTGSYNWINGGRIVVVPDAPESRK